VAFGPPVFLLPRFSLSGIWERAYTLLNADAQNTGDKKYREKIARAAP
jgi:hypothetical protein